MGRPKVENAKDQVVRVRMDQNEMRVLELLASQDQASVSALLRDLVRERAQARGLLPTVEEALLERVDQQAI